eukprot:TRINITY_DN248_c1_g1_i3.p1 TRINITY_DN248_c1_g1~~TRINITY_DN248_c1_g1_i3.p1  ORF type:complete len:1603 (-),score=367.34 TRINITY_DN248_c1_g1_i3:163-4338(-)
MPPPDLSLSGPVTAVGLGSSFGCVLLQSSAIKCWGANNAGQLGVGSTTPSLTPVTAISSSTFVGTQLSAGQIHSCIVTTTAQVVCWGFNYDGPLGNGLDTAYGDDAGETAPIAVVGLTQAVAVSCSYYFSCGLTTSGQTYCWGQGTTGQLGTGGTSTVYTAQVSTQAPPAVVPLAAEELGCALLRSGDIKCWGRNDYGQIGLGNNVSPQPTPPADPINLGAKIHSASAHLGSHVCALLVDGDVTCWGVGGFGELGLDSTVNIGDDPGEMPPQRAPLPPFIHGIDPTSIDASALSTTTLTILGSGFNSASSLLALRLNSNPVPATFSFVSPVLLELTFDGPVAPGSYSVQITRTNFGTSNALGPLIITATPSRTRTVTKKSRTRTATKRTRTRTRTATIHSRTRTKTRNTRTGSRTRTRSATGSRTLTPQPAFISFSARLADDLRHINFEFALPLNVPSQRSLSCAAVFSPALLASFGLAPSCWLTSLTLSVALGLNASISVGAQLSFSPGNPIPLSLNGPFRPLGGSSALASPSNALNPEAAISGPQTIGSCDGVVLGGSTTQSGNRPSAVQYVWSVVSPSTHNITLPSTSASTWAIPASSLAPATTYVFGLQTTNFLGRTSAVATTSVTKSTVAVPVLEGPAQVGVTTGDRATLVQVSLRAAPCTPAGTAWSATWSFAPGSPTFVLDTRSKTSLALAVNPASLTTGVEYNLLLTVSSAALGVSTSTGVVVERAGAALVAVIQGRSSVASDEALVLDASQSYDPDTTGETASFSWSCVLCATAVVSDVPCAQTCIGFSGSNSPVLSIGTGQLVAQRSYIFTVTYTKGLRSTTASRVVAVQPPSEVAVAVAISQANVLWQLTQTLTLQSDVCDTANPAVEIALVPSVVGTIISGVGWVFEGVDSSANRSVPVAVTEAVVGSSSSEAGLRIPASVLVDWQGYTFYIRVNALLGGTNIGSAVVCFRVGIAPVIGSFSVQQVDGRLRYSAVLASNARADYVIGFRTLSGGPRTFISFQQIFRTVTYSTVSRLSYYQNLVSGQRFLAPCPAATVFAFVFACQSGICVEQEAIAPLDCASLAKTAALPEAKRASVGDCAAVPDPFGQALCAVQAVQTTPGSATAAAAALSVIKSAHAAVPAGYGSLMVFAGHHAAVVAAAGDAVPTDVSALKQLLSDPSFAAPLTLDALFASVSAQISGQCTTAAAETLAQFGQKALETRACGGTPAVFATSAVGVVATQAVVGASGRVDLGLTGQGVSHVVVEGAGSTGSCAGIAASVQGADCGAESGPFVLALGVESGFSRISFDAEAGGECVAWDESAGAWSETGCTRSGVRCTCGAASKYTVREAKKSGGGSNAGAIAGGVIGAVVGVGAGVGGALWWRKKQGGRGAADVELR